MKWIAHFDNYKIKQFDDNGNEILYREVLENIDNLKTFVIMDNQGNTYSLDLKTQTFSYNEDTLNESNLSQPYTFSYYRKCSLNLGDSKPYVIHCMGLENDNKEFCFIEIDAQTNQYRFSYN